jgi:hypothetical protein
MQHRLFQEDQEFRAFQGDHLLRLYQDFRAFQVVLVYHPSLEYLGSRGGQVGHLHHLYHRLLNQEVQEDLVHHLSRVTLGYQAYHLYHLSQEVLVGQEYLDRHLHYYFRLFLEGQAVPKDPINQEDPKDPLVPVVPMVPLHLLVLHPRLFQEVLGYQTAHLFQVDPQDLVGLEAQVLVHFVVDLVMELGQRGA